MAAAAGGGGRPCGGREKDFLSSLHAQPAASMAILPTSSTATLELSRLRGSSRANVRRKPSLPNSNASLIVQPPAGLLCRDRIHGSYPSPHQQHLRTAGMQTPRTAESQLPVPMQG